MLQPPPEPAEHLPGNRHDPDPVWLWCAESSVDAHMVTVCWRMYLRRFDLKHCGVHPAVATTMLGLKGELHQSLDGPGRTRQGIGELEQGVLAGI